MQLDRSQRSSVYIQTTELELNKDEIHVKTLHKEVPSLAAYIFLINKLYKIIALFGTLSTPYERAQHLTVIKIIY